MVEVVGVVDSVNVEVDSVEVEVVRVVDSVVVATSVEVTADSVLVVVALQTAATACADGMHSGGLSLSNCVFK